MQFALQMYENAVALDPNFAIAHAAIANVCAQYYYYFERKQDWIDRVNVAAQKAIATGRDEPEIRCAEAWLDFAQGRYASAVDKIRAALNRDPDIDGGYHLYGRALFESAHDVHRVHRYQHQHHAPFTDPSHSHCNRVVALSMQPERQ